MSRSHDGRTAALYLLGTWTMSASTHVYLIAPASVLPRVADGLAVPEATAVWLVSAVLGAWAVTNLGVGVVVDRAGDLTVVVVAGALVVAMAFAGWVAARAGSFWPLMATRVVAGAGIGAVFIAGTTLVGRLFPTEHRGTAVGVFTTSAPAGFAAGQVVGPQAADAAGWPVIFAVGGAFAAVGLVVIVAVHVGVREFGTGRARALTGESTGAAASRSTGGNFRVALRNRTVLVGAAVAFAAYSLYLFLNSWLPTYLVEELGLSLGTSGLLAAIFPAMGVVSRAGGGVISDRLFGHRRLPVLKWSFAVSAPAVLLIAVSRSVAVLVGLLVVGGFVIQLTFGVVYSYVQEAVDPAVEGTALSLPGSGGMAGAFTAPVVAGALIDATGAYTAAFAYAAVLAVAGLGLVFVVAES